MNDLIWWVCNFINKFNWNLSEMQNEYELFDYKIIRIEYERWWIFMITRNVLRGNLLKA